MKLCFNNSQILRQVGIQRIFFLAVMECFCILMKDIQCWRRQSQQQLTFPQWKRRGGSKCLQWTASADSLPQELLPRRAGMEYSHSQEFQIVLTPLTCQTRFCDSKQSHQTCKINESGAHTVSKNIRKQFQAYSLHRKPESQTSSPGTKLHRLCSAK